VTCESLGHFIISLITTLLFTSRSPLYMSSSLAPNIPCPYHSLLSGPGLQGGRAGELLKFKLQLYNNLGILVNTSLNCNLRLAINNGDAAGDMEHHILDHFNGTYTITVAFKKAGEYEMSLFINNQLHGGNPVKLRILASTEISSDESKVIDLPNLAILHAHAGKNTIKVMTCDFYGNRSYDPRKLLGCRSSGCVKILDVIDFQDGIFQCEFICSSEVERNEGLLEILLDGNHVKGSPLRVVNAIKMESGMKREKHREMREKGMVEEDVRKRHEELAIREEELISAKEHLDRALKDLEIRVPPKPFKEVKEVEKEAAEVKYGYLSASLEEQLGTLRAKELELHRLLEQIKNTDLKSVEIGTDPVLGSSAGSPRSPQKSASPLPSASHLKAVYDRVDPAVAEKRKELEVLLQKREKMLHSNRLPPAGSVNEVLKNTFVSEQQRLNAMDAESRIRYSLDKLFDRFAKAVEHNVRKISISDAVSLAEYARLPIDGVEVVEMFLKFLTADEKYVSKESFVRFLLEVAKIVYRDGRQDEDRLASLFEEHLFSLVR
jgi:Filamin/ABP280 repeat